MTKNKLDIKTGQHIRGMLYCMLLLVCILVMLYSQSSYTIGWWIVFICIAGAIITAMADICYVYAKYLIHKAVED